MYDTNRGVLQLNVTTASGLTLTSGDKHFWTPGFGKVIIRWMSLTVCTAIASADQAVVALEKRVTSGSDSGRVTTGVPTVTVPGSTVAGKCYYKQGLEFEVKAGEELVTKVTDATATGAAHVSFGYEIVFEHPSNNANMVASA